jgi:hypothetical protein
MEAFSAMASWQGEFTEEYFAQPTADPATFGMPAEYAANPRRSRGDFASSSTRVRSDLPTAAW